MHVGLGGRGDSHLTFTEYLLSARRSTGIIFFNPQKNLVRGTVVIPFCLILRDEFICSRLRRLFKTGCSLNLGLSGPTATAPSVTSMSLSLSFHQKPTRPPTHCQRDSTGLFFQISPFPTF